MSARTLRCAAMAVATLVAVSATTAIETGTASASALSLSGQYPKAAGCWDSGQSIQRLPLHNVIGGATFPGNTRLTLVYSPKCLTAWAYLTDGFSRDSGLAGCTATITRSDGLKYTEPVDPGINYAYTKMVYDNNITARASAYCDSAVGDFVATTVSY